MLSQEIRRQFIQYFKDQGHAHIPSSSVIPKNDPSLLFVNAGMNQFKDVFLGKNLPHYTKAVSSQKCIRVGGKHNDLENVGHTTRHLTFFEMIGNFSFGDYFKEESIKNAWHVTLNIFKFDPKNLFASVFHEDQESFDLWKKYLPEERIVRMGEKDNFWSMGEVGPCGPCSELYYDRGPAFGPARSPAEDIDGERFLEFWNLVFMEFNRDLSGRLEPLPKKCVDTGGGLERILSLMIGSNSLYETDVLSQLIQDIENITNLRYENKAPFRVIADHVRTLAFAIADGAVPSNIERGYVLRKIVRRAVRYGRQLGIYEPFLAKLIPSLCKSMGEDFPELIQSEQRICELLTLEETNFLQTLKRGGSILGDIMARSDSAQQISGEDAFKLKDTYGLPLEEILLLAKDAGLDVDIAQFEQLEHQAKELSRSARKTTLQSIETSSYEHYFNTHGASQFLGFDQLTSEGVILGLIKEGKEVQVLYAGEEGCVILDKTPFYAEKGGQVGDQGILETEKSCFEVLDTQTPFTDVITHSGIVKKGELQIGQTLSSTVNPERRLKIANNHTATHLLHFALHELLGPSIKQAGSIVEAEKLRFDFNYHKALSGKEIQALEDLVNKKIRENSSVNTYEIPYSEAQKCSDIQQVFDEKYGDLVRVVDIGYSKELCGGTHTRSVGSIGYFRITKESSISSGVRRIEAVSGEAAEIFAKEFERLIEEITEELKTQKNHVKERVQQLIAENKMAQSQIKELQRKLLSIEIAKMHDKIEPINNIPVLALRLNCSSQELREITDELFKEHKSLVLFLIGVQENRCALLAAITPDLVQKGLNANALLKKIAPIVEGKGGGKAGMAQGSGSNISKIEEALSAVKEWTQHNS